MTQPLGIDLFCGLGGWTEGLLEEGYYVVASTTCAMNTAAKNIRRSS